VKEETKHSNIAGPITFVLTTAVSVMLFAKAEMPTVQFYGALTGPGPENGDWTAISGGLSAAVIYFILFKLLNKKK
jgi:hypothetical protein